jgi:excisionase family DNA binding protein
MKVSTTIARESLIATARERAQAAEFVDGLDETTRITTGVELSDGRSLPPELTDLLRRVLHAVAGGRTVTIGTLPEALTTSTAADMLGISRPTLMKLIREGTIPSHKVGTHTRLNTADVLSFRRARLERQRRAFADLRVLEDELGLT